MGFPGGSELKASAWNVGDPGSIPGSGRSPGEGNGNPLQYSSHLAVQLSDKQMLFVGDADSVLLGFGNPL